MSIHYCELLCVGFYKEVFDEFFTCDTHLSPLISQCRAHSPCFGFCTHFDWLWQNGAEVLTQDARHSWHFTFCFLEPSHTTVRNLCHTERNQGLLIDSSNLWASWFSSMWRSWISQDQPRPQTTAGLVMIIGRRRTHQSSSRNMRKYTVVVTYTKDRLSPSSALSTALSRTLA